MNTERIKVCELMLNGDCVDADTDGGHCARIDRCPYTGRFIPIRYAKVAGPEHGYEVIEYESRRGD